MGTEAILHWLVMVPTIRLATSTVYLPDADAPMEVGRCHNGNVGLFGQFQQIRITRYQGVCLAGYCQFEKYLVVFVTAYGCFASWQNSVYDLGKGQEIAKQLLLF